MRSRFECFVLLAVVAGSSSSLTGTISAADPLVKFDVPALIAVSEVSPSDDSIFQSPPRVHSGGERTVQVTIPVSSEIDGDARGSVQEFRLNVFWNRNAYLIADYGPQTQTISDVEGTISVEKVRERNLGLGINLKSGFQEVVTGSSSAEVSQKTGTKIEYQEVPQHDVLISSGTVRRGTGAFFRFHPSKRDTLEGSRDLVVAYRVPLSWRGGVLKVECRAVGERKIIGSWKEPFEESRSFVVPIYLDGDGQARAAAMSFAQAEQTLRVSWNRHVERKQEQQPNSLQKFFGASSSTSKLPDQWVHYLIQSGNDMYLTRYQSRLPRSVAVAAESFVGARQGLLKLSR